MPKRMTNKFFVVNDAIFMDSVKLAQERGEKVEATSRQASKFRNGKGIAHRYSKAAKIKAQKEEAKKDE